ncbi:MAG: [protein-PII] uridylyltransferase [Hydrogenophilales bacterium 28-61-23]|nr:MAG: [protein-PII] uridylyltransferase [Hydrogenophilales bacterium 28-61-23]
MAAKPMNIAAWRDHLAKARAELFQAYLDKPAAGKLLRGHARLIDRILKQIWAAHALPANATLVAVGGYGRYEHYPQSDVDVLILFDDALPEAERARFEPLIALLWDVGLPIGHSVRSLSESLAESAQDITIQTNMLESRWLAGNRALLRRMQSALDDQIDPAAFFQAKSLEQKLRHGRHADVALLLEPNLKESPGGLRDVQTLIWVARAAHLADSLSGLAHAGLLSQAEARTVRTELDLLAHLRIRLHLCANRREDRLLFEFQERIAQGMGIARATDVGPDLRQDSRRASERLMQRYYQAARHIRLINELVMGEFRARLLPPIGARPLAQITDNPQARHFSLAGNLLDAEEDIFERHPDLLLETFLILAREPGPKGFAPSGCTPRLLRALWRAGKRIDPAFRRDPDNRGRFIELLRQPKGVTLALRLMHRLGILGRYIPLFSRITGQMQHDQFHIYPVDEHILMVLRNLRRLTVPEYAHEFPLAHRVINEFERQEVLLLAALFHDIAKGRGGDHSSLGALDARRFCRAHGLDKEDRELVAWLVAQHLNLSQTAQKQDISDPEVIAAFAARCGNVRRLSALYLLTVADIRGTSPKVWNAWKDKLTRELYLAARQVLEGNAPHADDIEEKKEQARAQLRLYGFAPDSETALWNRLDDIYFLRQDARDIGWQTRRLLPVLNQPGPIVRARLAPFGEGVEVLVFAPDEEALFARICAFFARLGYSILAARIHTTHDEHALDTFYAVDPEHPQVPYRDFLNYIEHELAAELANHAPLGAPPGGRLPRRLKAFPLAPEVSLTPSDNRNDYILTFTAGDRPGLLASVALALHRHGVNVVTARINTLGSRAEDVFVIEGENLERASARLELEQALLDVLKV